MITEVPAATPVTTPEEVTVATEVVAEVQGLEADAVPDPVRVVEALTQAEAVPEMVGSALMVTVCVAEQPLLSVYVIIEVPAVTPVTTPEAVTVATEVVADVQGLEAAAVPDPVKVVDALTQAEAVPEMVGSAFTVTVTLFELATVEFASVALLRNRVVDVIPEGTSYVVLVAPVISDHVLPEFVDDCH